ncbi:MAG: biosynthetic-type acetolactate synthase large subunit [Armatimonadetes bacterium]|nr:biosynthetic-type acetolactate synthase large subunit [Armatimonadota bacterium]
MASSNPKKSSIQTYQTKGSSSARPRDDGKLVSGARALLLALKDQGCDVVFGIPGGVMLPAYDVLYDEGGLSHILVGHEQGAAHMADGYARATGKVGVCFSTSGPGATNLVTGICNAMMDSVPMVAITGQVRTTSLGKDAFQEADITGITLPITKHNYLVTDPTAIPRIIAEAFYIASSGRPGPVLVDIPMDIGLAQIESEKIEDVRIRSYNPDGIFNIDNIEMAARMIDEAERPVLYIGGGAISSGAYDQVTELARKTNIPVTNTLMGKGAFDETAELSLGMLGMHGTAYANMAVDQCDLLINIGARFDDRVTGKLDSWATGAKTIHIDIDPAEHGKVYIPDVSLIGDCKQVLNALIPLVKDRPRTAWNEQVDAWKTEFPLWYPTGQNEVLYPQHVCDELFKATDGEAIVATGVGQHQMWAAQFYRCKHPRSFVTSGGLGTMGFGLPAAIGAAVGVTDRPVWLVDGDGSFIMTNEELMPAVQHKIPVKIAIINNFCLGMVRQWQQMFYDQRLSAVDLSYQPDFVKLADAYGAVGIKVQKPSEVRAAIDEANSVTDRPVVIDFQVAPEENCLPMIPAGQTIQQMLVEKPR